MALKYLYQSKQKTRTSQETRYKEVLYGNDTEINTYINNLVIGTTTVQGLYLTTWRKSQYAAGIWQVECEYSQIDNSITFSTLPDSEVGKKSAQLNTRNLQMPLEKLNGYLQKWNHYLIQKAAPNETLVTPQWYATAAYEDFIPIADREKYRWVTNLAEIPQQPTEDGKYWQIVKKPTKPGVQYFDYAYFEVTENMKFRSASDAGTAINKNINKIVAPTNTFGITGGNWKLDSSTIHYTGSYWLASMIFTHSPTGWSNDLYGNNASILPETSSSANNNSSS